MALLGKEQLLQRPSLPTEDVDLPEFGGSVRVRAWTGADFDAFAQAVQGFKFDGAMFAASVATSAVNEQGDRMFDLNGDVQRIASTWPKAALQRTWEVVRRLNNLGKDGLEDAEKN